MTRVRGLAPWKPQRRTLVLLGAIEEVLAEYRQHWPLTVRQIFYRLVTREAVEKTEAGYGRVVDVLNRARRCLHIPFSAIRDDGVIEDSPPYFDGRTGFWRAVDASAQEFRLDRQRRQRQFVEVWVEAGGMVPMVARAVANYGVPVYSSGGFDSLTAKWNAASRIAARSVLTIVLNVGDYDASGASMYDVISDDVPQLVAGGFPEAHVPQFARLAVTPEQIDRLRLPTAPPKKSDKRSVFTDTRTTQAEALPPDELVRIVQAGVAERVNPAIYDRVLERERRQRDEIVAVIAQVTGEWS